MTFMLVEYNSLKEFKDRFEISILIATVYYSEKTSFSASLEARVNPLVAISILPQDYRLF